MASIQKLPSLSAGPAAVIARLVGVEGGVAQVEDLGVVRPAESLVSIRLDSVGARVALLFEEGDRTRPLIVGLLQEPSGDAIDVRLDGDHLSIEARRSIELRCGEASIVLDDEGRVIIKGGYVVSRSSGANKIKGGSVQIN